MCCNLPFIEGEPGKLLKRSPLPCRICGKLRNRNPDLSDHVNPWHMFRPGKMKPRCRLCVHVFQIDENQNEPMEEHMMSGFLSLILFYSNSITKVRGVMSSVAQWLITRRPTT
jgi:hypothetical protein